MMKREDGPKEWERVNGLWVGINEGVSAEMAKSLRGWVEEIHPKISVLLSSRRISVICCKRFASYMPESHAGIPGLWQLPGAFYERIWKDRDGAWRGAILMSEEWWPHGGSGWRSYAFEPPYAFRHEVGHAFAFAQRPIAHRSEPFRMIALRERAHARAHLPAEDQERISYFLGKHWSVGVGEIFAESYAAYLGNLPPGLDGLSWEALFRSAFPRSIAHVGSLIEAARA